MSSPPATRKRQGKKANKEQQQEKNAPEGCIRGQDQGTAGANGNNNSYCDRMPRTCCQVKTGSLTRGKLRGRGGRSWKRTSSRVGLKVQNNDPTRNSAKSSAMVSSFPPYTSYTRDTFSGRPTRDKLTTTRRTHDGEKRTNILVHVFE